MPIRRKRKIVTDPLAVAQEERALDKLRDDCDKEMLAEIKTKRLDKQRANYLRELSRKHREDTRG